MKGNGKLRFGSKVLFLLWRCFAKNEIRFLAFLRTFLRLWTRFIGAIVIFIAPYKHLEALVLRQFRIVVAETDFDVAFMLDNG